MYAEMGSIESLIEARYVALRDRRVNPAGRFDKQGRFYIAQRYECCAQIRTPSKRWPYSEMAHGRTKRHVTHEIIARIVQQA